MSELARQLLGESATFLRDTHFPRLAAAARTLPPEDLWWQPHPEAISVGTILRHLEGNVRQWILSGLGGEPDARERSTEFAATGSSSLDDLLARLETTVRAAAALLERSTESALVRTYSIQGFSVTGTHVVTHVVEHFAWHTGQAVWIAKARRGTGHGLAFYDDARINAARNS